MIWDQLERPFKRFSDNNNSREKHAAINSKTLSEGHLHLSSKIIAKFNIDVLNLFRNCKLLRYLLLVGVEEKQFCDLITSFKTQHVVTQTLTYYFVFF